MFCYLRSEESSRENSPAPPVPPKPASPPRPRRNAVKLPEKKTPLSTKVPAKIDLKPTANEKQANEKPQNAEKSQAIEKAQGNK